MKLLKKFTATKPQREVLQTAYELRQDAWKLDQSGHFSQADFMLRVADRLQNEVMLDKLACMFEMS